MDNYETIERKLSNRENFRGNSMHGFWDGATFVVFSYSTPIAWLGMLDGELDTRWYSATTNKHQGLVARALGLTLKPKRFRALA